MEQSIKTVDTKSATVHVHEWQQKGYWYQIVVVQYSVYRMLVTYTTELEDPQPMQKEIDLVGDDQQWLEPARAIKIALGLKP